MANDFDEDGDDLTIGDFTQPEFGGTVSLNDDGTQFIFVPNTDFSGTTSFTYMACDDDGHCAEAVVVVTVEAPCINPSNLCVQPEAMLEFCVQFCDLEGNAIMQESSSNIDAVFTIDETNCIEYTAPADFTGTDVMTLTACSDVNDNCQTLTFNINISDCGEETTPTAVTDIIQITGNEPTIIDVLGNDFDLDGDSLFIASYTQPPFGGTVTFNSDSTMLIFTPDEGFTGTTTFTYTVCDEDGNCSETTVTVTVMDGNTVPNGVEDTYTILNNEDIILNVLANDFDADGDSLIITEVTQPTEGGTVSINENGQLEFSPDENYTGTVTFTYTISDGNGGTDVVTVTLNIGEPNTNMPPNANDDSYTIFNDEPITLNVTENDIDINGDEITITSVTQPSEGGMVSLENGELVFTPEPNFVGTVTFTYTIEDENGETDTATVTLTIGDPNPNDAPDANDDNYNILNNEPITLNVLENDFDLNGDSLIIESFTQPSEGGTVSLNDNGELVFTPDEDFTGTITFTYTISDGNGGTDTATITLNIGDANENIAPNAIDDNYNILNLSLIHI